MKKIIFTYINRLLLVCMAATPILLSACEREDSVLPPVITEIRNYAASPEDTIVQSLNTGQWVIIHGKNLSHVSQVYFGGVSATLNNTFFTDESIVVQVPSIPFTEVPAEELSVITVINAGGIAIYNIGIEGEPIITHIRNYADAPNDTIVNLIFPDQQINLVGFNLKNATEITFQGVIIDLSDVIYTDSSAIVKVPADLSGSDEALVDVISYENRFGAENFKVKILGPPIITRISNENPNEGDIVHVYGNNFISVQSLTFAGEEVSSYEVSTDGLSVELVVPALSQSGPLAITTSAGSYATIYNVNDVTTGVLCNFDDISPVGWGGGGARTDNDPVRFPGNKGMYAILENDIIAPWDWQAWNEGRIVILDPVRWIPEGSINDPMSNWAVKFEINVPGDWNGTTLFISSEHNDYRAFYEPWIAANGTTFSYKTNGWQTLTFPLSMFYKGWGGNEAAVSITDLIGNTGVNAFAIQTMNISGGATATGLNAAVDNIRIVKIR